MVVDRRLTPVLLGGAALVVALLLSGASGPMDPDYQYKRQMRAQMHAIFDQQRIRLFHRLTGPWWEQNVDFYYEGEPYKELFPKAVYEGWEDNSGVFPPEGPWTLETGWVWEWRDQWGNRDVAVFMQFSDRQYVRGPDSFGFCMGLLDSGADHLLFVEGDPLTDWHQWDEEGFTRIMWNTPSPCDIFRFPSASPYTDRRAAY